MLYIRLVNLSGDVEKNPGPKSNSAQYLTIHYWNLNRIAAHNFKHSIQVDALLKACLSVHKVGILCLSEADLDSSLSTDDDNLQILSYSSVRADHPSNAKQGDF